MSFIPVTLLFGCGRLLLLLLPAQEWCRSGSMNAGLAFAASSLVLRKSRWWSRQKHLWGGNDVTVPHCQAWTGSRGPTKGQYPEQATASPPCPESTTGSQTKANRMTKTRRDYCANCLLWLSELRNRSVALSITKRNGIFLGQGQRKTSTRKAGKRLNFVLLLSCGSCLWKTPYATSISGNPFPLYHFR